MCHAKDKEKKQERLIDQLARVLKRVSYAYRLVHPNPESTYVTEIADMVLKRYEREKSIDVLQISIRQRDVFQVIALAAAKGIALNMQYIADELGISKNSIHSHVSRLRERGWLECGIIKAGGQAIVPTPTALSYFEDNYPDRWKKTTGQ